ncbi:hypothetical protein GCM10027277_44680 [Pseudoduganella ginsengisoli]|uniref:Transporter substrate-binding domain-containing protein n=2 Tax=Pseudoduganella ginsengisoli TaxID=1462440 RepID=A0A6L6Q3U6_9BURK|nr:transporter substrate-binding domain-containing protein [Pseudoduganella ginsengisoli]
MLLLGPGHAMAQQGKPSPTLDNIRKHGVIRVGVKTDFRPFNSLNANNEVVGFESDVAAAIAQKLGVTLAKVPITTENRFQKLALDQVDLLIATVGDTAERRKIATAVEPGYNETSVNILFPPGKAVNDWGKIRQATICAVQGSYFNKPMSERYLLSLQTYKTVRDAQMALRDGQCSGFLYATAALENTRQQPQWAGYQMPLPNALTTSMAIFIDKQEQGTEFDITLGNIVADMHRSGWLLETNNKWGISTTGWLTAQKALWSAKDEGGGYRCVRSKSGMWSADCRSAEYVSSTEVTGLQAAGLRLKEMSGIDLNFVYDPYDRTQFLRGILYTMLLIACSMVVSLKLGLWSAVGIENGPPYWQRTVRTLMAYGRLTPPLMMMYLLYFGVGSWTMSEFGIKIPAFLVAVLCSGYNTAGLIMVSLLDAAAHVRTMDPAFKLHVKTVSRVAPYANWPAKQALINMTKQTMIASAIAIPELLSASSLLIAEKGNIFLTMTVLLITFYFMTTLWTWIVNHVETLLLKRVPA